MLRGKPVLKEIPPLWGIGCGSVRVAYASCFDIDHNFAGSCSGFWHLIQFEWFVSSYKLPSFRDVTFHND